jgi:hypothetical protein
MKKVLLSIAVCLAFALSAAAQTGDNTKKSDGKKGAGGATVTGCLSGPNSEGVYELKSGKRTVEVGGNNDLSKHVGHEVKLHGTWSTGAAIGENEKNEKGEAAEKGEKGEKSEKGERHFKVTSIDHVSDTCSAGAAGEAGEHHHKKGSSSTQPSTPPKP